MNARHGSFLAAALLTLGLAAAPAAPDERAPDSARHSWSRISYPSLPCRWGIGKSASASVNTLSQAKGLRLDLHFGMPGIDATGARTAAVETPNEGDIVARLHTAGTIRKPTAGDGTIHAIVGKREGGTGSTTFFFDWGENELTDAVFELRFPDAVYWLELPYGFTRDPSAPLAPSSEAGKPKFPPALKDLAKDARIVPWTEVEYDIGAIENGWRASVRIANPFDARCDLTLYKDAGRWDLHSPRTQATIEMPAGRRLPSRCFSISTDADLGHFRTDKFAFARNAGWPDARRDWGTLIFTVDDAAHSIPIPSSLFGYVHGTADPYHPGRLGAR